jgi:hypothetical protein
MGPFDLGRDRAHADLATVLPFQALGAREDMGSY